MKKIIKIGDKEVGFKASAATINRYRQKFNRDLFKDINKITPKMNAGEMGIDDLECFQNIAYIMAWQYDSSIPDDPDDWLDQFEMFDIYLILPQIIELWGMNAEQIEQPKKKVEEQSGH